MASPHLPISRVPSLSPMGMRRWSVEGLGGHAGSAGLGIVITGQGTHIENVGIAGPLGATITSLRGQIDTSPYYKAEPAQKAAALKALDQYGAALRGLKRRVDSETYDLTGDVSVRGVNAALKRIQSDVGALQGQIARAKRGWQAGVVTAETIKAQAEAAKKSEEEIGATFWDKYKTPIKLVGGIVVLGLAAYLLAPAIRGLGARFGPKPGTTPVPAA